MKRKEPSKKVVYEQYEVKPVTQTETEIGTLKLNQLVELDFQKLKEHQLKLENEKADFERMKENFSKTNFPSIIKLDVGGHQFKTSISTLRREESMLSHMFSGSGYLVEKEADGFYFIDRPGKYFTPILHYLQTGSFIPPDNPQKLNAIRQEVQFYEIKSLIDLLAPIPRHFKDLRDQEGVLYWLGTKKGTEKYQNPYSLGAVKVSGNGSDPVSAVDYAMNPLKDIGGCSWKDKYIQIEVIGITIQPSSYSLSYSGYCSNYLHWRLEALDTNNNWKILMNHSESLNDRKNWTIFSEESFSSFRLVSVQNCYHVCHFEIYGDCFLKIGNK